MYSFPLAMRSAPTEIGVLHQRSLEITSGVKAIQNLVPLLISDIPSKLLLLTAIECHQLEAVADQIFFLLRLLS